MAAEGLFSAPLQRAPEPAVLKKMPYIACRIISRSYTNGMKTAVSIPDPVFARTELFARRVKKSRSRIVSDALREYLARHSPDEITEAMDRVVSLVNEPADAFVSSAAKRRLEGVEW